MTVPGPVRWLKARAACAMSVALLLTLHAGLALWAARRDSVTVDEFLHLPLGLHALSTGERGMDPINPPLPKMFSALPLYARGLRLNAPGDGPHWQLGYAFQQKRGAEYHGDFVQARSMTVVLSVLLGLLVSVWAGLLYGRTAAPVAAALYAFSPSLLAHGHLVTLDLAGALGSFCTCFAAWRYYLRPSLLRAGVLGATLGLAFLLKLSGFVLPIGIVASFALLWFAERGSGPWLAGMTGEAGVKQARGFAGHAAVAALMALLVVNAGYGFDGTLDPLGSLALDAEGMLARLAASWPGLALPLPGPFVEGVDLVLNVGDADDASYYFAGNLSADGWWYYHLAAWVLKTPPAVLLLVAGGLVLALSRRGVAAGEVFLLVPAATLFAANSLWNSLQIGARHVLPAEPLLLVFSAGALAVLVRRGAAVSARGVVMRRLAAGVMLAGLVVGSVNVAPRFLEYFQGLAGGPGRGHEWLVDSNLDWGQDLVRLREYMDSRGLESVQLAYFGRVDPRVYGVKFRPLERYGPAGTAVVSATFLMGRPYFWFLGGRMRWTGPDAYAWVRELKPEARVGSMFVYDLPERFR